jgi:hypothetical protein
MSHLFSNVMLIFLRQISERDAYHVPFIDIWPAHILRTRRLACRHASPWSAARTPITSDMLQWSLRERWIPSGVTNFIATEMRNKPLPNLLTDIARLAQYRRARTSVFSPKQQREVQMRKQNEGGMYISLVKVFSASHYRCLRYLYQTSYS